MNTFTEDLYKEKEILDALELFVSYGILIKSKKDGVDAWKNNPDFEKKSKAEQEEIFNRIEASGQITAHALEVLLAKN